MLVLSCTVNPEEPNRVILIGQPQFRSSERTPDFVREGDGYTLRNTADVCNFEPAAFRFYVPSEGVVVIGPSSQSRRTSSLGRQFLVSQRDGMEHETVLVLIPTVGAAASKPGGAAPTP